jgi:hypothetical protein
VPGADPSTDLVRPLPRGGRLCQAPTGQGPNPVESPAPRIIAAAPAPTSSTTTDAVDLTGLPGRGDTSG